VRLGLACGRDDLEVFATGQETVEARLFDDCAHARESLCTPGWDGSSQQVHRAGRRVSQAEQHPDQRRLAGAVRAQIAEGGSPRNAQVDIRDGDAVAEALCQPCRLDDEPLGLPGSSVHSFVGAHLSSCLAAVGL
jgi:hypothetical protein